MRWGRRKRPWAVVVAAAMTAALVTGPAAEAGTPVTDVPIGVDVVEHVTLGEQIAIDIDTSALTTGNPDQLVFPTALRWTLPAGLRIDQADAYGTACAVTGQQIECSGWSTLVDGIDIRATAIASGYGQPISLSADFRIQIPGTIIFVDGLGEATVDVHIGPVSHPVSFPASSCAVLDSLTTAFGFADRSATVLAASAVAGALDPPPVSIAAPGAPGGDTPCAFDVEVPAASMTAFADGAALWSMTGDQFARFSGDLIVAIIRALVRG